MRREYSNFIAMDECAARRGEVHESCKYMARSHWDFETPIKAAKHIHTICFTESACSSLGGHEGWEACCSSSGRSNAS